MGSIFENKYPTGHRDQKETGAQSYVWEELPDKEGLAFLDPAPHSPYPVGPDVLCPDPSTVPITEETDLRVQQVPWEGRDVTIPAVTPTFSSTSRPAASPEVPRDASSG